ncbi:hypothetical protein J2Z58_001450 [Halobacillus andaensis]|nr:hypothetical protein [Halobacillus andaensis]
MKNQLVEKPLFLRKLSSCRQERKPLPFPRTSARASSRNPRSAISAHSFFRRSGRGLAPWNFFKIEKDSPSPSSLWLDGRQSFSCSETHLYKRDVFFRLSKQLRSTSYKYGERNRKKHRFPRGKTENLLGLRPAGLLLSARPAGVGTFSVPLTRMES